MALISECQLDPADQEGQRERFVRALDVVPAGGESRARTLGPRSQPVALSGGRRGTASAAPLPVRLLRSALANSGPSSGCRRASRRARALCARPGSASRRKPRRPAARHTVTSGRDARAASSVTCRCRLFRARERRQRGPSRTGPLKASIAGLNRATARPGARTRRRSS